jgi:hypothetical protein
MYVFLADVVAGLHVAYVLAVLLGLLLTLLGGALGWRWVSNRWFRSAHLAMILGVVLRASIWTECPLTWWERDLRAAGGQVNYEGSVVGKFLHDLIHPASVPGWVFPVVYVTFAVLIVAAFWLVPVRWRGNRPATVELRLAPGEAEG